VAEPPAVVGRLSEAKESAFFTLVFVWAPPDFAAGTGGRIGGGGSDGRRSENEVCGRAGAATTGL
jgi:hypothetical protein